MGLWGWFQRVGSDPYYASYDKAMQRIKADIEKAKVLQQPQGKFTAAQHSARVAPVLLAPVAALVLHWLLQRMLGLLGLRDVRRDSTHYERTLELLQKYDPDFVPPIPPAALLAGKRQGMGAAGAMVGAPQKNSSAAGLASSTVQGAGSQLFPALGKLWDQAANKLIADDPIMVQLIKEARREADELRARLAAAEAGKAQLAAENRQLREQLGLPPAAEEQPGFTAGDVGDPGQGIEAGGQASEAAKGRNEGLQQGGGKGRESSTGAAGAVGLGPAGDPHTTGIDGNEGRRPATGGGGGGGSRGSALLASDGVGAGGSPVQATAQEQEGSGPSDIPSTRRRRQ
ncbi:hypothetical protein N2152v2_001432 [Parachlorella kessleri]